MATFDLQFTISVCYPAANAAYLIQTVAAPPLPAGFVLAGPLEADPQKAAAMMAAAPPEQHVMVNAMLADSNIFGLVAWNAASKTAIVAFRGTQDVKDWLGRSGRSSRGLSGSSQHRSGAHGIPVGV